MKLPLGSSGTGRRRASLEKTSPVESKVFSFTIINNRIGAQGFYEVILTSSAITSQAFSKDLKSGHPKYAIGPAQIENS